MYHYQQGICAWITSLQKASANRIDSLRQGKIIQAEACLQKTEGAHQRPENSKPVGEKQTGSGSSD